MRSKYKNGNKKVVFEYPYAFDRSDYNVIVYYPDGTEKGIMTVSNGMYVGERVLYNDKGFICQIDSFYKPQGLHVKSWDGLRIIYYENGKTSERKVVKNGQYNGLAQSYNGNGNLVKSCYLIRDSILNGPYYEYYTNGRVAVQAKYKMDTVVGNMYFFSPNGDTLLYFNHYKGKLDFPYKKWLDNGITLEGHSMNEKETKVMWTWYDKNRRELKRKVVRPVNGSFVVPKY